MANDPFALIQLLAVDETVRRDPFSVYSTARNFGDIIRVDEGFYLATTYAAVDQVLRDQRLGKGVLGEPDPRNSPFDPEYPVSMLFLDPPEHTRLRRAVVPHFTPSKIALLEDSIERATLQMFESFVANKGGDIVKDVAVELPISVIAAMLGVSKDEHTSLRDEVAIVARSLDIGPGAIEAVKDTLAQAGASLLSFFANLINSELKPTSVLSTLLSGPDPLSVKEASVMAMLLFMAGFETTSNLLGSIAYHLVTDEELYKRVSNPDIDLGAVAEEFLRLESPVQLDGRTVQRELRLFDTELPVGSFVLTLIGGANRDPRLFDNPDEFDFTRNGRSVMSFGAGIHHCIGAALARTEARIFLENFLRLPKPSFVSASRKPSLTLRGFDSVMVEL